MAWPRYRRRESESGRRPRLGPQRAISAVARTGSMSARVAELIATAPAADDLAVTMTGELCDCFRTKAEGVRQFWPPSSRRPRSADVRVYLVDGRFVSVDEAREYAAAGRGEQLACAGAVCLPLRRERCRAAHRHRFDDDRYRAARRWPARGREVSTTPSGCWPASWFTRASAGRRFARSRLLPWRGRAMPGGGRVVRDDRRCLRAARRHARATGCRLDGRRPATDQGICPRAIGANDLCRRNDIRRRRRRPSRCRRARCSTRFTSSRPERAVSKLYRPPATIVLSGAGEFLAKRLVHM